MQLIFPSLQFPTAFHRSWVIGKGSDPKDQTGVRHMRDAKARSTVWGSSAEPQHRQKSVELGGSEA